LLIQESHQEVRADTKTTTFVRPGETMNGKLENNQDHDWYKVDVKAGITYKFILKHTNNTDHLDPWLNLRGTNGKIIKSDDDSAGNLNSLIQFKATQNATYYLDACSWREISHGQFSMSVMAV
jgi:serralysin